jgi:hypothetical protein
VTKLAQDGSGENPVVFIDEKGETVRWHGEHADLRAHVREVVRQATQLPTGHASTRAAI